MTDVPIERLGPAETRLVAERIANAFLVLPATWWLVPDATSREEVMAAHFELLVEHAMRWGIVYGTVDRQAVAVWLPQGTEPTPETEDYDVRLAAACGAWVDRFRHLDELFAAHHPTLVHHHLAFMAVHPQAQGQGLGSALLRHHHAWLDANGVPAYLEASSEAGRTLYARHGYRDREPFHLPDGTPFYPMWRDPTP